MKTRDEIKITLETAVIINYSVSTCADKSNQLWHAIYFVFKQFVTVSNTLLLNCFQIYTNAYVYIYIYIYIYTYIYKRGSRTVIRINFALARIRSVSGIEFSSITIQDLACNDPLAKRTKFVRLFHSWRRRKYSLPAVFAQMKYNSPFVPLSRTLETG